MDATGMEWFELRVGMVLLGCLAADLFGGVRVDIIFRVRQRRYKVSHSLTSWPLLMSV